MSNLIRVTKDGVTKDFSSLEDAKKEFPDSEYLVVTDHTPAAKKAKEEKIVRERAWRDAELVRTDTIVDASDYPNKTNMVAYRKELRDWPSTAKFPASPRPVLKTE
tara:strand:- start:1345 stop:1662 length:318 start_codon:yes stop_codon:yes gene_type:complete